jgi:hypothetical protein
VKPIAIGRDIKLCGALFLLVGLVDVLLIEFYPAYPLKMFGGAVTGPYEYPAKLHSPVVHFLIGYGFLFLRSWGWGLAVAYGTSGIVSELMNQLTFGFHVMRTGFVGTTILFLCYLVRRRAVFMDEPWRGRSIKPASHEVR